MSKEDRIGAAWKPERQSDKGPMAKGTIDLNGERIKIVIWPNRWKQEGERSPDFYIERDTYEPQKTGYNAPANGSTIPGYSEGRNVAPKPQERTPAKSQDFFADDVPF